LGVYLIKLADISILGDYCANVIDDTLPDKKVKTLNNFPLPD